MDVTAISSLRPRRSRSLAQDVVDVFTQRINDGTLQPGDKLPTESAVMGELGVSRTVVREAISRLQAAGLVETRHGVGTFVLQPPSDDSFRIDPAAITTLRDVLAILELRISLEVESAGLAALRRSDAQLAAMREALDTFINAIEHNDDAIAADFDFHLHIARATGNEYFPAIMVHLGSTLIPRTRLNSAHLAKDDQHHYLEGVNAEHEDIYQAILRRDPEAARAAMRRHLSSSRERLQRANDGD